MHYQMLYVILLLSLDSGHLTMEICIDHRKICDTVSYDYIKLEFYDIRVISGDFVRSYLSSRSHFASLNNIRSKETPYSLWCSTRFGLKAPTFQNVC